MGTFIQAAAAVKPCAVTQRGGSMADRAFQAERRRCLAEYSICRKRHKRLEQNCSLERTIWGKWRGGNSTASNIKGECDVRIFSVPSAAVKN